MKRLVFSGVALLTLMAGYALYVMQAPVCVIHAEPVMFSALGRAERAVLPERAGAIHYAWRGQGSAFCSVTRFEVPDWVAFKATYVFQPAEVLPQAFAAVPQELAQLPWWQPQRVSHPLLAVFPDRHACLLADDAAQVAYLLVSE